MSAASSVSLWAVVIGCALMAGVYLTFSSVVMSSLEAIAYDEGIAAMQSINRVIVRTSFMPIFFATSLASLVLVIWGITRWGDPGAPFLVAGGLIYVIGMFGCTAAFNVPLNNVLDSLDPTAPASVEVWVGYLRDWTRWNHVRTLSSAAASVLFLAAAQSLP